MVKIVRVKITKKDMFLRDILVIMTYNDDTNLKEDFSK